MSDAGESAGAGAGTFGATSFGDVAGSGASHGSTRAGGAPYGARDDRSAARKASSVVASLHEDTRRRPIMPEATNAAAVIAGAMTSLSLR